MAAMFVYGGFDSLRNPASKVPRAEKVVPDDTERLVRVNGAVQLGCGIALALGVAPRLAALSLAASLVPTTAAGHRFWEEDDDARRAQQKIHFLKNVSMLGGLLMVVSEGR
jgi:putative oxidoreductase